MSDDKALVAIRREAKRLSRTGDMTYQQALDDVARRHGHAHWNAASAVSASADLQDGPARSAAAPSRNTGWRRRELERMSGARHSPADEWLIANVGGRITKLMDVIGLSGVTGAIIATYGLLMPVVILNCMFNDFGAVGTVFYFYSAGMCAKYALACYRSPDHQGARRARRNARSMLRVYGLVAACALWPYAATISMESMSMTLNAASMMMVAGTAFVGPILVLSTTTWIGRDRQRRGLPTV